MTMSPESHILLEWNDGNMGSKASSCSLMAIERRVVGAFFSLSASRIPFSHSFHTAFGASKMKAEVTTPYQRKDSQDLIHYPDMSKITKKRIDWMYDSPKSGYEGANIFGPNTIEIKGLPACKTPEYMQERLRRFFSKFGFVAMCRCIPHSLDPYQCEGTAYIAFRAREAALEAAKTNLQFPPSLQHKILKLRHLDTDVTNKTFSILEMRHHNNEVVNVARQLYQAILKEGPRPLSSIWMGLIERRFRSDAKMLAEECIIKCFGNWITFLTAEPFRKIFLVRQHTVENRTEKSREPNRYSPMVKLEQILEHAKVILNQKVTAELTTYWRNGKHVLPRFFLDRNFFKLKYTRLSEKFQMLSRPAKTCHVFDERFLFKLQKKRERSLRKKSAHEKLRSSDQQASTQGGIET
ncbi:hypothetical protein IE077_004309 [Cardiosporidium cionae]|uniref:RRM domain-containing protein n=1 Tax=Cardiosporidium cionae TaxID=476202 RepID=A0ABQ7JC60_9APIC|nr:hypothetical protein IE077_004309 [Cardiosporidium cionae]|eukprot:KAF8821618.1 hypothetical protein IE077_004309 [Cardiosporidium cionae]